MRANMNSLLDLGENDEILMSLGLTIFNFTVETRLKFEHLFT